MLSIFNFFFQNHRNSSKLQPMVETYLRRTFSICFCWNLPFMISWLLPSIAPLVPSSANRNASRCFGVLCNILAISVKLAKAVFLVPTLTTWVKIICFININKLNNKYCTKYGKYNGLKK